MSLLRKTYIPLPPCLSTIALATVGRKGRDLGSFAAFRFLVRGKAILLFLLAFAFNANANISLYGFDTANPYTSAEKLLKMDVAPRQILNYREAMRQNINMLSAFGKERNPEFVIIVHEAEDLLDKSQWEYQLDGYQKVRLHKNNVEDNTFLDFTKKLAPEKVGIKHYISNIDAIARNNLLCHPSRLSPTIINNLNNLFVLSIDHCSDDSNLEKAIHSSIEQDIPFYGFIHKENAFNKIKKQLIVKENTNSVIKISDARNLQLFIDDSLYKDKAQMLKDIADSNYDIIIINPLFHNQTPFSAEEISSLKLKKLGPKRLIIAYQNISEARPTDYFWQESWKIGSPSFLRRPSFVDKNAIIAEYWSDEWREIISNYFKSIVDSNYDGAFLTGLQNYEYFETQTPLD